MLTTLQEKKLSILFRAFDADSNGFVERSDYTSLAKNLAAMRQVAPGSHEFEVLEGLLLQSWEGLRSFADSDGDGRVSLPEWYSFHDQFLSSPDAFSMFMQATGPFVFALMDRDHDGKCDVGDYRDFLRAHGIHVGPWADENFRHADTDGDGRLDAEELGAVIRDFYYSDDPTTPASNWLGPVA